MLAICIADIYTRTSNAFLIGEIFGMLGFGLVVDRLGRKTGVVSTTALLVLGIALSAAASGKTQTGMFWMLMSVCFLHRVSCPFV
jgi:MFS family permease